MADLRLSKPNARALVLAATGLDRPPARRATKTDVLAAIRRMGALQIDTIHVVARSPYLVLRSRLGDYDPAWLDELLAEGRIFEYWSHEACFLPVEHYSLYRRLMLDGVKGWKSMRPWLEQNRIVADHVLDRIRAGGPVRSSDFERTDGRSNGWWDWKPEKRALECLHTVGELMIARRDRFQRIYDLRERVLPEWDDARAPLLEEALRTLSLEAVRALGVARARWVPDYFRTPKPGSADRLERLADEGALLRAEIDGLDGPAYVHPENEGLARAAAAGEVRTTLTTLLSPFDPLVWDRTRASELFDFDYRIECYTPAQRRVYGYFTLPILRKGKLIGRLDPKAHRREGVFEVKALHLEPGVAVSDALVDDLRRVLAGWAAWHGTPEVVVSDSDPPALARRMSGKSARVRG